MVSLMLPTVFVWGCTPATKPTASKSNAGMKKYSVEEIRF